MSNAQILVVEDEGLIAQDIEDRLKRMGYGVPAVASSGDEALEKAAECMPDLVLMDIVLRGGMDGIQASERLREQYNVPVVYLTAYEDSDTLRRAKATEPFGYLLKPYQPEQLRTAIEIALYKHRMESLLKCKEQWLAATLASIGDGVVVTDLRGVILLINAKACAMAGCRREEAVGKHVSDVFHAVQEETRRPVQVGPQGIIIENPTDNSDPAALLVSKDGRETPIETSSDPIHDDKGNYVGIVMLVRDVTTRRWMEEALRLREERLHKFHKMEAIGRLAAGMVHDFNQYLTIVMGNISLVLSASSRGDPNRPFLEAAEKAALNASGIVKNLLAFTRQSTLRLAALDLRSAIQDMVQILRSLIDARIDIDFNASAETWPVEADRTCVDEVLLNLCLNARDAMPSGGALLLETANISIDQDMLRLYPQGRVGDFVRLRVQDTGCGMSAETQARVFEPFFTTKSGTKGTGLGLAMVYGIVEQHRGWIECHSKVHVGTQFDVYLPRYQPEVALQAECERSAWQVEQERPPERPSLRPAQDRDDPGPL